MKLEDLDFTGDIEEFEFSKEDARRLKRIVSDKEFSEMSSNEILEILIKELKVIPFGDYLKRYLYLEVRPKEAFRQVPDKFYIDLIMDSFKANHVPLHLGEATTTPRRLVGRWLTQTMVSRDVVFLLGFGLRMKTEIISEFLQKVLQDEDFDYENAQELIYWYCLEHQKPYAYAQEILRKYEDYPVLDSSSEYKKRERLDWQQAIHKIEYRMFPEKTLERFLKNLKQSEKQSPLKEERYQVFKELYDKSCQQIAAIRMKDSSKQSRRNWDMITPVDVEKELYAGVPREKSGNLQRGSLSRLSECMNCHFLSRQRIEKILSGKYQVRRYDLINLCFYLHASERGENQKGRFGQFLKYTDQILERCHMSPIHPSHPSESFLMICMLSDMPLILYSDVLEVSFENQEE